MDKETNYVIGFDLGKKYAQISFVTYEGGEGDVYNIPVCLCKRNGANQWFYGEEALKFAAGGRGTLIGDLTSLAVLGEPVLIEEKETDPIDLLTLFIRHSLSSLGVYKETAAVKAIVMSLDTLSSRMLSVMERVKAGAMADFGSVFFESKVESLFYYTIHQPKELWSYEVGVVDFSGGYLKTYRVEMNHKTKPILTTVEDKEYEAVTIPEEFPSIMEKDSYLSEADEKLYQIMEGFLEGRIVTSIYLTGKIFEKEWCPKTLKLLCRNRKVFGGSNLYSKGACLSGMERIAPGEKTKDYLYLGKEKLKANIGVYRIEQGKQVKEVLMEGGVNWFDAKAEFTFMPGEDYHLPILILPLEGAEERIVPLVLPEFPNRDIKSLKFNCRLSMKSERELSVEVEDAGFGEFYKPTGRKFEETILLGGNQ